MVIYARSKVRRRGQGVHFLMQTATNGTRAGLLSDFGGRREDSDEDAFETAARELTEETAGAGTVPLDLG